MQHLQHKAPSSKALLCSTRFWPSIEQSEELINVGSPQGGLHELQRPCDFRHPVL